MRPSIIKLRRWTREAQPTPFFLSFSFLDVNEKRLWHWWLNGDGWREAGHVMETGKKRSDVLQSPSRPIG